MSATLSVVRPGMLTTVQDLGRWGYQSRGVPVAGPMDVYSHRRANRMVGNAEAAAALEITLVGPELRAVGDALCAVAGAQFHIEVDGKAVDTRDCFQVRNGQTVRFGARTLGARETLAVRGGFDVPAVLGSRATSVVTRTGPFGGRALRPGDALPIGTHLGDSRRAGTPLPLPAGGVQLRLLPGPDEALFTPAARQALVGTRFTVSPQSNRMGYRLLGGCVPPSAHAELLSSATPVGSLQVPASGEPILLMADRQTTGGYPRVATVISADLPLAGQLAPGDWIEFVMCTLVEALDALREQEIALQRPAE